MTAVYRVGERVDGLYDENTDDMWYPGRIRCVHVDDPDGESTFEVLYDDGEVETHVRPEFLRQHVAGTICVGTRVLCRYDGGDEFYPGQISDVQDNGCYTIAYDDGEVEENVPLEHITEASEKKEEEGEAEPNEAVNDPESEQDQQVEDNSTVEVDDPHADPVEEAEDDQDNTAAVNGPDDDVDLPNGNDETTSNIGVEENTTKEPALFRRMEQPSIDEPPLLPHQQQQFSEPANAGNSAESAGILESLNLLEKRLGDPASTKSVLSTLVKQMRAYPQVTADLVHERGGERSVIDALKFHQTHAVIQCYGFVLLRRLCFLCVKSTHYLLRNGIVELVLQAINSFPEDAILQASACGALAVFTRVQTGLNMLIEYQVAQVVLSTLIYHKTYSVHTRQVHYYACEVLLELCELDDLQTLNLLCGEQEEEFTSEMSPISLLLFLLRQGLSLDDKKACCAVGSLLMCLAASGRRAAALILSLNGLAELSTVMARYPTEPSIQKYSSTASKQIALCSVRQSPTKRIKETATEILREAEALEGTSNDRPVGKKNSSRVRSVNVGKRKSNPSASYGGSSYPRGGAYNSVSTPHRFTKAASPYKQAAPSFAGPNSFGYSVSAGGQQPSSLVILDGSLGGDSFEGNKRRLPSKEERQSELLDAYGIQGIPSSGNGRSYGTKRAQLRAHLASAENAWATPGQQLSRDEMLAGPTRSRPDYQGQSPYREFVPEKQTRWEYENEDSYLPVAYPESRQPHEAKRKKKNPVGQRTGFQVRIENESQLRVSRELSSPFSPHKRLGAATKRAAKARQKRISAAAHSSIPDKVVNASSESLNEYATQLFQDSAARGGSHKPTNSRLTPREKEEIRERERLSFAEKLHKMIDKAKSSLANGNTTSLPMASETAHPKRSASTAKRSEVGGKTRAPVATPADTITCPQSNKKIRTTPTPKSAKKDVISPRETAETKLVKPTAVASKRQALPSDVQLAVPPRVKVSAARPVAAPKCVASQKAQDGAKPRKSSTEAAGVKPVDPESKPVVQEAKAAVVEEPLVDSPVVPDAPPPAETKGTDETFVSLEDKPEILTSNGATPNEINAPVSVVAAVEAGLKPMENLPGEDTTTKAPVVNETNAAVHPEMLPSEEENSVPINTAGEEVGGEAESVEKSDVPAPAETSAEQGESDNPSTEANAITDAMYGDNEFDDNGGDDDDMVSDAGADADEVPIATTPVGDPVSDIPLQASKSGEELYENDGYSEFEEEDSPPTEDAVAQDVPVDIPAEALTSSANPQGVENDVVADNDETAPVAERDDNPVVQNEEEGMGDIPGDAVPDNDPTLAPDADAPSSTQGDDITLPTAAPEEEKKNSSRDDVNPVNGRVDQEGNIAPGGEQDRPESVEQAPQSSTADTVPNAEQDVDSKPTLDPYDEGFNDDPYASVAENTDPRSDGIVAISDVEGPVQADKEKTPDEASAATTEETMGQGEERQDPEPTAASEVSLDGANPTDGLTEETSKDTDQQQADESPVTITAGDPQMENDADAKALVSDPSTASIQSAVYDEDNFEDEETPCGADEGEEVKPNSATDTEVNPSTETIDPATQDAETSHDAEEGEEVKPNSATDTEVNSPMETIDPATQDAETSHDAEEGEEVKPNSATDTEVNPPMETIDPATQDADEVGEPAKFPSGSASDVTAATEGTMGDPDVKEMVANSSEASIQSAVYDDEDFDDTPAREDSSRENAPVNAEELTEPSDSDAVVPDPVSQIDSEATSEVPDTSPQEDQHDIAEPEHPIELTADDANAAEEKETDKALEEQNPEPSEGVIAVDAEVSDASTPSAVNGDDATHDVDKINTGGEEATVDGGVAMPADTAEEPVESPELASEPADVVGSNDDPDVVDTSAGEGDINFVATAEPTYDDDEFNNAAKRATSPAAETLDSGTGTNDIPPVNATSDEAIPSSTEQSANEVDAPAPATEIDKNSPKEKVEENPSDNEPVVTANSDQESIKPADSETIENTAEIPGEMEAPSTAEDLSCGNEPAIDSAVNDTLEDPSAQIAVSDESDSGQPIASETVEATNKTSEPTASSDEELRAPEESADDGAKPLTDSPSIGELYDDGFDDEKVPADIDESTVEVPSLAAGEIYDGGDDKIDGDIPDSADTPAAVVVDSDVPSHEENQYDDAGFDEVDDEIVVPKISPGDTTRDEATSGNDIIEETNEATSVVGQQTEEHPQEDSVHHEVNKVEFDQGKEALEGGEAEKDVANLPADIEEDGVDNYSGRATNSDSEAVVKDIVPNTHDIPAETTADVEIGDDVDKEKDEMPTETADQSESTLSATVYGEDFPADETPSVTDEQVATVEVIEPTSASLPETDPNLIIATTAEDDSPESSPTVNSYEDEFPSEDAPSKSAEERAINATGIDVEAEIGKNNSTEDPTPPVNSGDGTTDGENSLADSPSKEEFYNEGFDDEKVTADMDESAADNEPLSTAGAEAPPNTDTDISAPSNETNPITETNDSNPVVESEQPKEDAPSADESAAVSTEEKAKDNASSVASNEDDKVPETVADPDKMEPIDSEYTANTDVPEPHQKDADSNPRDESDIEATASIDTKEGSPTEATSAARSTDEPAVESSGPEEAVNNENIDVVVVDPVDPREDAVDNAVEESETAVPVDDDIASDNSVVKTVEEVALVPADGEIKVEPDAPISEPQSVDPVTLAEDDVPSSETANGDVQNEQGQTPDVQEVAEVAKEEPVELTSEVNEPPSNSSTADAPEVRQEELQPSAEEIIQPDYADDEPFEDDAPSLGAIEAPITASTDESDISDKKVEIVENPTAHQETAEPPAEEEYEAEYESPRADENVEASEVQAGTPSKHELPSEPSDEPKYEENEYENDDDGYNNDFDDHGNTGAAPAPAITIPETPSVDTPNAEPPATEDEYEGFENDDDIEEEKPAEAKPVINSAPSITESPVPSEPPTSAREEIEEMAGEAEEEAYEEDQGYNDFEADDTPTSVSKPKEVTPPEAKKVKPIPAVEASEGEDYEDEEYGDGEDDFEETSPAKPAPSKAAINQSDGEMDDEVGYDSEYNDDD